MDVPIPAPAACEVRSVIKFLNAQGIAPIEIDRQLCQVYGPNVMSKQMVRCSTRSSVMMVGLPLRSSSCTFWRPAATRASRMRQLKKRELYEEKRIEAFEMWIWRRMERVKWTDRIRNEAVLERVGEERMMLKLMRKRKRNWLGHWLRRNCLLKDALEGMVNGRRVRRVRGRRRYQMIDDIKIMGHMRRQRGRQKIGKSGECWVCSERQWAEHYE
ncbi:hypothetical protein ANN_13592 [Periplaneta americana]|uniref:Uncharacterized protein n=1 Tax=Periplaneta americana TaxID=6978 RepID=A0ABQ8TJT9_PERAM|nr:hypothetical protein ANN_13592 [Periplaneta americana]